MLDSPLLRCVDRPIVVELLKHFRVVISLAKEVLVHQSDVCSRVYLLKQGSLQASGVDRGADKPDAARNQSNVARNNK